jgi:hypothetical protein
MADDRTVSSRPDEAEGCLEKESAEELIALATALRASRAAAQRAAATAAHHGHREHGGP